MVRSRPRDAGSSWVAALRLSLRAIVGAPPSDQSAPDGTASGKIPLIVNIYGGPAAQLVTKGVPNAFDEILARKGFAIFCYMHGKFGNSTRAINNGCTSGSS